ncbi:unnamed protein product [Rotaria sp. Silwood2]|nr:unnamed protein product [Rotaria sp. Silwood2]CAF4186867.1 unnamed protein product [Rotaria sp. Silwood2]
MKHLLRQFIVNFDAAQSTSISTSMDKEYYRQVPYRFFNNESNTDACKLEKLTNLFPDMKAIIELELFKMNNLTQTIDRLSRIYTVLTALDTRDDTLHLFLGPYHLSLGPALFAALHFKNASAALLTTSRPTISGNSESQRRKRRHEIVLRRFRRAVRKLTLVKSIIGQLRSASILTPYNQYELYTQGIYDLVLAGHEQCSNSTFINDNFLEQLQNFDLVTSAGERSPLLASNYVKINNILSLLSSPLPQQTPLVDNNKTMATGKLMRFASHESITNAATNNDPTALINSSTICCPAHDPAQPYITLPARSAMSPQPNQMLPSENRSRHNSSTVLLKTPSTFSRQSTVNSLPESTTGDGSNSDQPTSKSLLASAQSNPVETELDTPTKLIIQHPFASSPLLSSSPIINEDDALINRISSLLTSHLLSRQLTSTTSITPNIIYEHETNSNLSDSAISLSTGGTTGGISSAVTYNQSSPSIDANDIDKLLQRIKTAVDNRLSIEISSNNRMRQPKYIHRNLSSSPVRTATINRRQQLLALHAVSCQESHTDDYDVEHSTSSNKKHKLDFSSKSQSFDVTTLNNRDVTTTTTTIDTSNNIYEMTTFHSDDKGVQTDPRIRHARSKLLETLQAYVTAVIRYRQHLFKQYTQSNTHYEQHYNTMPELQQYEYRDLINVRKEILHRFEWVINELEQTIDNLQSRRLSVADAQRSIDRPLVKEVIESSLNADLPPVDEHQTNINDRQRPMPSEDEWKLYARDLQDTKEDLYFINSLVHRGISKIDRLVTFTNLYT